MINLKELNKLSMKSRPERCLFLPSNEQRLTEICMFQMRRFPVRILLSLPRSSSKVVYIIKRCQSLFFESCIQEE